MKTVEVRFDINDDTLGKSWETARQLQSGSHRRARSGLGSVGSRL